MFRTFSAWVQRHERRLSAAAMAAGFIIDNVFFNRIDVAATHYAFGAYTLVCFVSISLLHYLESRGKRPRWRPALPIATQFALGGFWSGLLIFYGRAADLGASWPFLLLLVLIFLGNEYFRDAHDRLVFTSILFFFALYSYAIFLVPVYMHAIGDGIFLLSGVLTVTVFALFTVFLRHLGRERFMEDVRRIRIGAAVVLIVMNVSYFTNILPPLPLSLSAAGIYHSVSRVPGAYLATTEVEKSWTRYLGFAPTLHVVPGGTAYAYAEVFAPTALNTTIVHEWQWYDPESKKWVTRSRVKYGIQGGREKGYKGYSLMPLHTEGKWRVSVQTVDGRTIARLSFTARFVETPVEKETITLE